MGTICPFYLRQAALKCHNPVERLKFVIVSSIAYFEPKHSWEKPLNPILGETLHAFSSDGGEYFLE
jgi:hypothetical protein